MKNTKTDLIINKIFDTVASVQGTYDFQIYEMVEFEAGNMGYVVSVDKGNALITMLDGTAHIGEAVYPTGETFNTYVLTKPFGKMYDADGTLIKDLMTSRPNAFGDRKEKKMFIFEEPKTIYTRAAVGKPIETGTFAVDTMIPVGRGQRELIVGDSKTGKTAIAVNMLLSQKDTDVKNIYVAIGKKRSEINSIIETLRENGVLHKTILIVSSAEDNASKKIIAPYTGMAFARFLCEQSEDSLVILDDLSIHADAHRELSLLVGLSPGREAFPGDVFYMHSKLLENAGNFNHFQGNGSITAIPIVETYAGDISGYIPTNVISITDGQIYTSKKLFNQGIIPAIDIPLSVSRVGSAAQTVGMKLVSGSLKSACINYHEQLKMGFLGSEINSFINIGIIQRGKILYELNKQHEGEVLDYGVSALMSGIASNGYFDFYSDDLEIFNVIKEVLLSFLKYDVLGKKMAEVLAYTGEDVKKENFAINKTLIDKYLIHIVLPLIKYHILKNVKGISKNKAFVSKYDQIRVDSRILLAHSRKKYDVGIAYDYKI